MLFDFLTANRSELIRRCHLKVAQRCAPADPPAELGHGVTLFLDQVTRMLPGGTEAPGARERGIGGWNSAGEAQLWNGATKHGEEMLTHRFTIEEVVRDYGDLCQAITQLAEERGEPISAQEFGVLNLRLDDAIAGAVTEFARPDTRAGEAQGVGADPEEPLATLAHEMRNFLNTAILALSAIKRGNAGFHGATAGALDRSLIGMRGLIDKTVAGLRLGGESQSAPELIELAPFILQVQVAAALEASHRGCELDVLGVEPGIFVEADRHILAAAIANLLENALNSDHDARHVLLRAYAVDGWVRIEVEDDRASLPQEMLDQLFRPDVAGARLGLSISRRGVEASGGKLYARNIPGKGCICVIELPRKDGAGAR